jgi:hypothetical protein
MVNTSADNVDSMVDDQPIMLSEQGQEMGEQTPQPQQPAAAPQPQPPEPRPRPSIAETHRLCGLEHLLLGTLQKARPAVPTLRQAEAARNTSDVDVDQQLLDNSAGGNSLPNVPLSDAPLDWVHPDG